MLLFWFFLFTRLVSTTADVQRKSVAPLTVIEPKEGETQTINTAPITIHIPVLQSHASHEPSDAPAAIAQEAPEGTYLLPVTEHKADSPPAVNLVVNLRLLMDREKKPEQSDTAPTPRPVVKANAGEYVAHEVKLVNPNFPTQQVPLTPGLSAGIVQADMPPTLSAASRVQSPIGTVPQQPQRNYGVAPSLLLVPKRRVLHNVRSNVNRIVPDLGTPLIRFRQQILSGHNSKRLLHRIPLLTEDQKLNQEAQRFAIKLAKQKNMTHSLLKDRVGEGENIALRCSLKGFPLTGVRATNLWYRESKKFNWKARSLSPATKRFTQMVWKNTSKAGFGRAQFKDKVGRICFVVVARYEPAGNQGGKLMDNVFKPSPRRR